jgi:starch synthase
MTNLDVTVATTSRFESFDLALQLERLDRLDCIFSAYPSSKLKNEAVSASLIRSMPGLYSAYALAMRGTVPSWLRSELHFRSSSQFAAAIARKINIPTVFAGMSGSSLEAGQRAQSVGGFFVCRRGSAHIQAQATLLAKEAERWGFESATPDQRMIDRELAEYEIADAIVVPSRVAASTYIDLGLSPVKVHSVPLGVDLDQFRKSTPKTRNMTVLFVGHLSLRKGLPYLLQAFSSLDIAGKKLQLIGTVDEHFLRVLRRHNFDFSAVEVVGSVSSERLRDYMSSAHVLVLPSVEDGFGLVVPQAMACETPVIVSSASGASDLIVNGENGYVVPAGDAESIAEYLELIAADKQLTRQMGANARRTVEDIGGWDTFGKQFLDVVSSLGDRQSAVA